MATSEPRPFEYDRVAYTGWADPFIQLRNLEVIGHLFAMKPADISNCRVLELACSSGRNVLPYALEFPQTQFVGIDLAVAQVEAARDTVRSLGLTNIEFRSGRISEITAADGEFDYILCPGVFSWTTDDQRQAILRICREQLAPRGVAAISYNVFPGWHTSWGVREYIRRHVRVFDDPNQQIAEARKAMAFIAHVSPPTTGFGHLIKDLRDHLRSVTDTYLYHDYITDMNQPFYFHEFVQMAGDNDLQFVSDAQFREMALSDVSSNARGALEQLPLHEREQFHDFIVNRQYHRSVVCRRDVALNRRIDHQTVAGFSIAINQPMTIDPSAIHTNDPLTFEFDSGSVTTSVPAGKAAVHYLSSIYPASVSLHDLHAYVAPDGDAESRATLAQAMLACYASGLVRFFQTPPQFGTTISEFPTVAPLNRMFAAANRNLISHWHENRTCFHPDAQWIAQQLDGTISHAELERRLAAMRCTGESTADPNPLTLAEILERLRTDKLLAS